MPEAQAGRDVLCVSYRQPALAAQGSSRRAHKPSETEGRLQLESGSREHQHDHLYKLDRASAREPGQELRLTPHRKARGHYYYCQG